MQNLLFSYFHFPSQISIYWSGSNYDKFWLVMNKGETITRVNGNVLFFAGKRLQNFYK